MGFNATWSMAVGGMVGGGIFTVLGVIIALAGSLAWLSFLLGGIIAFCTGYSYTSLSTKFQSGGGAFDFLRQAKLADFAGGLSWVLIMGYALTISVYGYTFGHYLNAVVGAGSWLPKVAAATLIVTLVGVNLLGVGQAAWLEIVTVWGKLAVLLGLAAWGLVKFNPANIAYPEASPNGIPGALIGAAAIFMAYEGFQLLTYDYADIRDADRTLPRATLSAIVAVIVIYIMVTLGAASLVGAGQLVAQKEIALAAAGQAAFGTAGLVLVSIAAVFSTASAINATLFATARLARRVATDGELPAFFCHLNARRMPDRSLIVLGLAGAGLAVVGNLSNLVEAASLVFLFTFVIVNVAAYREHVQRLWLPAIGAVLGTMAFIGLVIRLAMTQPLALVAIGGISAFAVGGQLVKRSRRRRGIQDTGCDEDS
ncbi:MAG: amino acid permease [Actinobacteria bacterium HGW-Actinobacteria-7]|jgi:hypothetical protein|nr:MAG: amino acid permease [Actinobacteria bacterium HGW-Actinobacteria-7]